MKVAIIFLSFIFLYNCNLKATVNNIPLVKLILSLNKTGTGTSTSTGTNSAGNSNYTISGVISGYTGSGLILTDGTENLTIATNATTFNFTTNRVSGYSYTVSVKTQPTGQTCTVTNGTGSIANTNVTSISVNCITNISNYTISGVISGYTDSGLVLTDGTENLTIATNATTFNFTTNRVSGYSYTVSVKTQPTGQTCTVTNGTGSIASANVTNVSVSCVTSSGTSGTWTTVGNLQVLRTDGGATATLLNNGKILITGGYIYSSSTVFSSAELFDPSTGQSVSIGNMNSPRVFHSATLLSNGKVLLAGGSTNTNGGTTNTSELFDPSNNTFTNSGNLNTSRNIHSATLLQNNNVLIVGGQTVANGPGTNSAEIYNVSNGTFTNTGSMSVNRYYHSAMLLNNGKVVIIGGVANTTVYKSTEIYDPQTGNFQIYGNMNAQRMLPFTVKLSDTKFLIIGGSSIPAFTTYLSSVEILDSSNILRYLGA